MRIPHWKTLLGRRLGQEPLAPWMLTVVVVSSLLPSLLGAARDLSLERLAVVLTVARQLAMAPSVVQVFAHALGAWTSALLLLLIGFFALAHCRTERTPEVVILAAALPVVALLELHYAGSWLLPGAGDSDQTRLAAWLLARLALAASLLAGGGVAILAHRDPRWGRWLVPTCLGAAFLVLGLLLVDPAQWPRLLRHGSLVARPWDLLPLVLLAAAGLFVFPQLHRQRPSILSHALMLSMLPQVVAQLEAAFGSILPEDGHAVVASVDKILGYAAILAGVLFDYVQTQRSRADAMTGYESAQLALRSKTQELVRADRELVDQDILLRQAERSLRILEKAVETMSLGVTVSDLEGRILYVNPADARMHGFTVDELRGANTRVYSPPGAPASEDSDSVFLQPWSRERVNMTRDGRTFPVRLVSDIVRDESGQAIGLMTLCEDISERKRIEAALERRDRVLEAVGLAAERFLANPSWEESVGEVLESLKRATGVDRVRLARVAELKPQEFDDTWIVVDPTRDTAPVPIALPTGEISQRWERELRAGRLLQGRVRDLPEAEQRELLARGVRSFAVVPIFVLDDWLGFLSLEDSDEDREWSPAELEVLRTAARTFGAAMHRKQAETALAASQAKYQDLLESASDLVQSISPVGRFQFVNRAWKATLGYNQEEVSQLTFWDVVHPEHHPACREALEIIAGGGHVARLEVVFVTKGGSEIYVEGSLNGRFVAGELMATRGIFRDITERKIVDRMKSEFISTVSHELRTPLTSIIASLGLLQSGRLSQDGERVAELVTVAYRNSNRLLQLINDLLDLQKLAAGKIVYRLQGVDVLALLEEVLRGIRVLADSFKIELRLGAVPAGLHVRADRDRLIQVLNNLLSNAIKFSAAGETVTVLARQEGERGLISVADHGPGIPKEFQARLFERFTQFDSSATRSAGGSGLGLSIVKGLVEGMGGTVHLDTELGRGTTFHVELPVAEPGERPKRGRGRPGSGEHD